MKNKKYKIELDEVYPKKRDRYTNTLQEAKRQAKQLLQVNPQGKARIKELKVDGETYKSVSSHWWAKSNKSGRDRIVGL